MALALGSSAWLPNSDQMSYSACQIGPTVSYWCSGRRVGVTCRLRPFLLWHALQQHGIVSSTLRRQNPFGFVARAAQREWEHGLEVALCSAPRRLLLTPLGGGSFLRFFLVLTAQHVKPKHTRGAQPTRVRREACAFACMPVLQ
jgi:hypothetical protein